MQQKTLPSLLQERLQQALRALGYDEALASITPTADARFGDYQTNAAMVIAKQERKNPREVAQQLIGKLNLEGISSAPEVAGAGFINFRLTTSFLEERVTSLLKDPRCGVPLVEKSQTIVIDFSSPNVAKPMHVGHIKSTVLGDSLARTARFVGHHVITDNHLGDWGTQFGKVIYGWKNLCPCSAEAAPLSTSCTLSCSAPSILGPSSASANLNTGFKISNNITVHELVQLYREVNALEETDPAIKASVREELVKLQQGDPENVAIWKNVVAISWREFKKIYTLLNISFDECLGESSYNEALQPLVDRLSKQGIAEVSQGALVVFFKDHPTLAEKPFLIRKADGGFLYSTTDIATLEYPDAVWYVCGVPQQLHFEQLFAVAKKIGITSDLRHIAFGSILGEDRKMMKTRSGDNVELASLLEEAVERAFKLVSEKHASFSEDEKKKIAAIVGLGALKYADLMQHRMSDSIFSWDKMLSFQGNTAPYLQNAYVRIQSIVRKEKETGAALTLGPIVIKEDVERALTLQLLQFADTVAVVLIDGRPNILCLALFELANSFHRFYEQCPILKAEECIKKSRLALAELTARILKQGLYLLGIEVPERM